MKVFVILRIPTSISRGPHEYLTGIPRVSHGDPTSISRGPREYLTGTPRVSHGDPTSISQRPREYLTGTPRVSYGDPTSISRALHETKPGPDPCRESWTGQRKGGGPQQTFRIHLQKLRCQCELIDWMRKSRGGGGRSRQLPPAAEVLNKKTET